MSLPIQKVMIVRQSRDSVTVEDKEKFPAPKYFGFYMALGFEGRKYEGLYVCVSSCGDWIGSQVVEGSDLGVMFLNKAIEFLKENGEYTERAYLNSNDRIEANGNEFRSGDVVDVFINGKWNQTRIEHFDDAYQSIHGYRLIGNPVVFSKN